MHLLNRFIYPQKEKESLCLLEWELGMAHVAQLKVVMEMACSHPLSSKTKESITDSSHVSMNEGEFLIISPSFG